MAEADVELPKAQIRRIIQSKLPPGPDGKAFAVNKDALLAFSESAKVFISYISTTANDICKESKRQTISAEDVIKALEELEFSDLLPQLKEYLETYKKCVKERNQKRNAASKKRRADKTEVEAGKDAGANAAAATTAAAENEQGEQEQGPDGERPAEGPDEEDAMVE